MYPIQTITLNIKFKQKCTGMKSSHDAPIIHAFNLAQKRLFYSVWGTYTPFNPHLTLT